MKSPEEDPKEPEDAAEAEPESDSVPHTPEDEDDLVDKASADSFPASDPPAY